LGANTQSTAAKTNGMTKCITPYGSHARISSTGCVYRVRMSEMLAPYRTDSSVGKSTTWISGLHSEGMNFAEKKRRSHERMGVAGRTNCEVIGSNMARMYAVGMRICRKRNSFR
jgi:hypothetical protein